MDTFIGFFLFASVIWLMVNWWFHRVINKQKNALVGQLQGERFWRILIATPPFFERAMHVYSAEGGGVLIDEADSVLIKGLLRAREGEPIEQRFTKEGTTAHGWASMAVSSGGSYQTPTPHCVSQLIRVTKAHSRDQRFQVCFDRSSPKLI